MAYDLFFLSYNEPHAEENWLRFKARFQHAKRVDGVDGIFNAHRECAKRSLTTHFFVVDADNEILDFDFKFTVSPYEKDYVHLWYARNPVNGLEYGWGGLKLFPKKLVLQTEKVGVDMTTSFPLKIIPEVVSITNFNTSAFDTWRSAFREGVKLSNDSSEEAVQRLNGWHSTSHSAYSAYALHGVVSAREFLREGGDPALINDWVWLREQFDKTFTEDGKIRWMN
jgi:hypothetical protein